MEKEMRSLLNELCVDLGFCLPPFRVDEFALRKHWEADTFASAVLAEEGMDPDLQVRLFRQVKKRFTDRFGHEICED